MSEYLRAAPRGHPITVCDRDTPVARLVPSPPDRELLTVPHALPRTAPRPIAATARPSHRQPGRAAQGTTAVALIAYLDASLALRLILGEPVALFQRRGALAALAASWYPPWDVAADGRFIMTRSVDTARGADAPLIVVENWFDELKARLAR